MRSTKRPNGIFPKLLTELMGSSAEEKLGGGPLVNIAERSDCYIVEMAVPGYDKHDFIVEVEDDYLEVLSVKDVELGDEDSTLLRHEYIPEPFSRSFQFSEDCQKEGIKASYSKGILKVTIQKKEASIASRKVRVEVE
jgi:HSP20 family protein